MKTKMKTRKRKQRQFQSAEKVAIIRQHLIEKKAVSDICDEQDIHPSVYYRWQKQDLCFELDIPFGNLGDPTHSGRVRELVQLTQREGRLADLVAYSRNNRAHVAWPDIPKFLPTSIVAKEHVAIVVSLAQPALEKAADFLQENQLDASVVLITNVPASSDMEFLKIEEDWDNVTAHFRQTMGYVTRTFTNAQRHFFFAGPMPLIFAMGAVWGTVHMGDHLYHYDRTSGKYAHVLTSSGDWLSQSGRE